VEEEKSMTDADSIWESKLSRLQDPNLEKMEPLVELMGELRERSQERGEPRSHAPGAKEGTQRPWWCRVFGG
jgi:hypothetical protein